MSILNLMFSNGENSLISAQWEFLDTPPARSWRNMVEHMVENPEENSLAHTDAVFCASVEEAQEHWRAIRDKLIELNHVFSKLPFNKLKHAHTLRLLDELHKLLESGVLGSIDRADEIKELIEHVKRVGFYLEKVKDTEYNNGNADSAFGAIMHRPDPYFGVAFKPEWLDYMTMDIVPGTIYADLAYNGMPWFKILEFGDIVNAYESIRLKKFGEPTFMGCGFTIPFNQDVGGVETELIQYFYDNIGALKHLDPSFDPIYALKCSGRIPVARLVTKLGERGYPGYQDLSKIQSMFKMETYEAY